MACVNLVFASQKLNSNGTLQPDTRGFNAAFSLKIPSVLLCNLRYKCSNWTDLERLTESVYLLYNLYLNFARSLAANKLLEKIQVLNE